MKATLLTRCVVKQTREYELSLEKDSVATLDELRDEVGRAVRASYSSDQEAGDAIDDVVVKDLYDSGGNAIETEEEFQEWCAEPGVVYEDGRLFIFARLDFYTNGTEQVKYA